MYSNQTTRSKSIGPVLRAYALHVVCDYSNIAMAPISEIRAINTTFAAQKQANSVCVFVGATNGIGRSTLYVLSTLLVRPTIYIVGRSTQRWKTQLSEMRKMNSEASYIFVEAEVSMIREADRACKQILEAENRLDYLCMSTGYLPMVGAIGRHKH